MKKVLFLIHTLGGGGAEKVLVNLANGMDKSKFEVTVMTVINTGIFRESLSDEVKYKYIFDIPFRKKIKTNENKGANESGSLLSNSSKILKIGAKIYSMAWKYMPIKALYKYAIKDDYDVEIAFLEGICAKIIASSTNKESKKISWIHVDLINQDKSKFVFKGKSDERQCYDKFDEIICVSEVVKKQFIEKFNIDGEKVKVKYNPINSEEVIIKSLDIVDDIKKPDKFLYCSVGRLISQKGYDRLLRIHKELIMQGYNYELWIIGEGNKRSNLESYIMENNLQDSVKLLGFKKNPYKYMKMADAFVCSSRAEGFSTVASESTILEKPIVTVNCSGMTELLGENNEYGIVTKNNENDLLEGMRRLLENEELYRYYTNKIKERKYIFDIKESLKSIEELCE